jgi:stearoyl-CoA desaturase (Delta-9 desaturase)
VNLVAVVLPFLGFVGAVVVLWNSYVGWTDLAIMAFMYVGTALGITIGFHRLYTHRAFDAVAPVRYGFAVLGSMAVQGPVIDWVADHRKHHAFADDEGDPHSPHGHGTGFSGAVKGLLYAHVGWLAVTQGQAKKRRFAPDLLEDPVIRRINRSFPWLVLAGLAIPFGLGYALSGTLHGALTGLLWGGFVRIFLLHHITWSINSVCHFFGSRRFQTDDHSTNVFWLALPSLGESWHHNHHAFPRSAFHGLRWYEIDVSGWLILGLEKLGLARNVITISPERQEIRRREGIQQARIDADRPIDRIAS